MTIEERRAEILRKRLLNQRLANAKFSDYQTPMGGPRRGALRDSTLGVLSDVISNDENDLDNLSFSTLDGVKVNLQNNRAKDSTPTNKIADFSWYHGNYGTDDMIEEGIPVHDLVAQQPDVHPRILAMQELKRKQELERGAVNRENAIYNNPGTDAINSFIEANSAKSNGSLGRKIGDGMGDNLAEVMAIGQQLQENHGFDNIEPLADKSLYQIPDHPYGDIHDSNLISDYANYFETIDDEALLGNEDSTYDANGYLQDWRVPLMDDWTGDGEFDHTGAPINPNNLGILGDESAAFDEGLQHPMEPMDDYIQSTLDTSYPYVPSDDYYNAFDELTEEEQLAIGELDAAQEWRDNNIELAEQLDQEYMERHAESFGDEDADFDADDVYEMGEMDDGVFGPTADEALTSHVDKNLQGEIIKEEETLRGIHHDLSKVPEGAEAVEAVKVTKKKMNSGEISQEEAEEEASNIFSWFADLFGVDDKSLLRALVKYIGGMLFGLTSGKAAAFAWAGVEADMAREAAKGADARAYAGNMAEYQKQYDAAIAAGDIEGAERILSKMNDLSGIERTDAEEYEDNMTKYDEMYDTAMEDGNIEGAERILSKMNDLSGVDKTEPEKYYEGLEYLQGKLADAKKANVNGSNDALIEGIEYQLDKWKKQGVTGGTRPNVWMGSAGMYDPKGTYVVKSAMQVEGEPIKIYDETDGTFKLPSDLGYRDAIRTPSSDRGTGRYATDERVITDPAEFGRYSTEIPNAISVSPKGVPKFEEGSGELNKAASFSHTAVKSFMQMEDILSHSDAVRQEIFSLQAEFRKSIADMPSDSAMKGLLGKFAKRGMSPAAKLWFNEMNTLVTSKLRRETGAAYNQDELITTMNFFPNATDYPANFNELDKTGKINALNFLNLRMQQAGNWILTNAQGLQAYEYLEGLKGNLFRPDDDWLKLNTEMLEFLDAQYNPQISASTVELIPIEVSQTPTTQ